MALSQIEATADELLSGLPHGLDHVFRPWAQSSPHQPALIGDGKVWTYGYLPRTVDGAAAELRKHGVRPGDRVDTAWVRECIKEHEGEQALTSLPPGRLMRPEAMAESYWTLYQQPRNAWSSELEIRPFWERW